MSEGAASKVPHWPRPLSLAPAGLILESGVHTVLEADSSGTQGETGATQGHLNQSIQSSPEIEKGSSSLLLANPVSLWAFLAGVTVEGGDPRGHPAF